MFSDLYFYMLQYMTKEEIAFAFVGLFILCVVLYWADYEADFQKFCNVIRPKLSKGQELTKQEKKVYDRFINL